MNVGIDISFQPAAMHASTFTFVGYAAHANNLYTQQLEYLMPTIEHGFEKMYSWFVDAFACMT